MEKAKLFREDGSPRWLRCFETKRNPTIDRFCIVFTRASQFMNSDEWRGWVYYVASSGSPEGFYQHGEAECWQFSPCGTRISFWDLPERLRNAVLAEYRYLWGLEEEEGARAQ